MEWNKIKKDNQIFPEFNFENNENATQFYSLMKMEYIKKIYQTCFWLIVLIVLYVVFQFIMIPFNKTIPFFISDQVISWVIFVFYLLIYFFNLSYPKFMPTTINYLEKELETLGYKMQKKYKIRTSNCFIICFSVIFFILININLYISTNYFIYSFILRLLIIFIFTAITIPIFRGKLHDMFLVNLRNSYFVQIELKLKLIKHIEVESQMVRLFMTSNRLCSKEDQVGNMRYNEITKKRWLKRYESKYIFNISSRKYLFFREYATLINFKEQLLNIVSAIREWDKKYSKTIIKT